MTPGMVRLYDVDMVGTTEAGAVTTIRRREHAYDPVSAIQQALINAGVPSAGGPYAKLELVHVGPPAELIDAATIELGVRLSALVRDITDQVALHPKGKEGR